MNLNNTQRIKAAGFLTTFELWPVNDEWSQELYNYLINGWQPGSFHSALFANDLSGAVHSSHIGNQWNDIQAIVKWITANAPADSVGSYENVKEWLALTEEDRNEILTNLGWLLSEEELTWKLVAAEEL